MHDLSITFAAGCFGGLANALAIWGLGKAGVSKAMKVEIAPAWSKSLLYPKLVWGGIWGWMFLLPWMPGSVLVRGVLFSLAPTAVVCLIVFPFQAKKGFFGLELGMMTPVFALIVNAVWGIAAAWWLVSV